MPNPHGNPTFKPKYDEKTKVMRLPISILDIIASLFDQGCASSDIVEQLQPLAHKKPVSDLVDSDSTHIHIPIELRFLRAIKDAAKQEKTHYIEWILNQCKKGLNSSLNLSPTAPAISPEEIAGLIDERFDNLVTNLLDSLQTQLAAYESRITQLEAKLEAKLEDNPTLPIDPPEATTAIAEPAPEQTTSQSGKPTKSGKQTPQSKTTQPDKSKLKPDSNPIKLPKNFPPKGIPSVDLARLLNRSQKTINEHRRKGNGFLSGWEPKKVKGHAGWRYFPTTPETLKLWKDAIKRGLLNPASAATD